MLLNLIPCAILPFLHSSAWDGSSSIPTSTSWSGLSLLCCILHTLPSQLVGLLHWESSRQSPLALLNFIPHSLPSPHVRHSSGTMGTLSSLSALLSPDLTLFFLIPCSSKTFCISNMYFSHCEPPEVSERRRSVNLEGSISGENQTLGRHSGRPSE